MVVYLDQLSGACHTSKSYHHSITICTKHHNLSNYSFVQVPFLVINDCETLQLRKLSLPYTPVQDSILISLQNKRQTVWNNNQGRAGLHFLRSWIQRSPLKHCCCRRHCSLNVLSFKSNFYLLQMISWCVSLWAN